MKKLFCKQCIVILLTVILSMMCVMASAEEIDGSIVLPAAEAAFVKDKGVSRENKKAPAEYDDATGMIWNLAKDAEVTFEVPDGVDGEYDVYLTVSKIIAQFTSQPFCFSVAGGDIYSIPVDCPVAADSPAKYSDDGDDYNTGKMTDKGRFLIAEHAQIKAGDKISVYCSFGAKGPTLKGQFFPGVGDVLLVPAGTPVGIGYDLALPVKEEVDPADPLSGKTILWLGSSVTYGAQSAGHYSMVDAVEDLHPALTCEKYAISATTLVNQSDNSYVARLKLIPKDKHADLVVVQLSTNDAGTGKEFGTVSDSFDQADFDDTTIAGAIETIIAYTRDTFGCPLVFYTGTLCDKENYAQMVTLLHEIEAKWNIGVIDMFNDEEMTAMYRTSQYRTWMGDEVHPRRSGYIEWWTPVIDAYLTDYMK